MDTQQTLALIGMIIAIAFLYWLAYQQGVKRGHAQSKIAQKLTHTAALTEARQALGQARFLNRRMRAHCDSVDARSRMGEPERQVLMQVASTLTRAAERLLNTRNGEAEADELIRLRNKTLIIASMLAPIELGDAA